MERDRVWMFGADVGHTARGAREDDTQVSQAGWDVRRKPRGGIEDEALNCATL
jgi:hypothetical protein